MSEQKKPTHYRIAKSGGIDGKFYTAEHVGSVVSAEDVPAGCIESALRHGIIVPTDAAKPDDSKKK